MRQTTIIEATNAPYLLRELIELGNLVFGMLAGPNVTVRHWPVYYRVYVEVDGLCREVNRLAAHLMRGFVDTNGTVDANRAGDANACFARIDGHVRAIAALLADVVRDRLVIPGNPTLVEIVDLHFVPESDWYRGVQAHYRSGCITPDGRTLARTVLPIDPHQNGLRGNEATVDQQRFDLVSDSARTHNGRTTRQVQTALNQVYAALGDYLVRNCPSVSALLHPHSTPRRATLGAFYSARTLQEMHEPVKDLPGGLAVYINRDRTSASIGTRGIRPADGMPGMIIHLIVDITEDDSVKHSQRFIPAQPLHNSEYTGARADELKAVLLRVLIDAGLATDDARFDVEPWRYR